MVVVTLPETRFVQRAGAPESPESVRALFCEHYYYDIPTSELDAIGPWKLLDDGIEFDASEKSVQNKLSRIATRGLGQLRNTLYDKPTCFIDRDAGVPLLGSNEFGIVDRGSNILEVKPVTGCNLACPHCSVDEGPNRKLYDYLVDEEYLLEEAAWIAATRTHPIEWNIGPQGEPLLYPKLTELVRGLAAIPGTKVISVNTNGTLLTKARIDALAAAGLTRINLSLNALSPDVADRMAGRAYPLARVLEMLRYCVEKPAPKIAILLAPLVVPGMNEHEMPAVVKLSTTLPRTFPTIGIQNFLEYPRGRRPAKAWSWERFAAFLRELETITGVSLDVKKEEFGIFDEEELPRPFRKNAIVSAMMMLPGRYPHEAVGVIGRGRDARCITISGVDYQHAKNIKVKIVREKHNIYKGVPVGR